MENSNSVIDTIERKNRAMIYTTGDGELGWAQLGGDSKAPASKVLCKIKSEAGEIAKGCVLVRRWGGADGRLKTKEGRSTALLRQVYQAVGESFLCLQR